MEVYKYLIAIALSVLLAHAIKSAVRFVRTGKFSFDFEDGGFPSGHAAIAATASTMIFLAEGVGSPLFALAVAFYLITANDAIKSRRSIGEQGEILKTLTKKPFRLTRGHTFAEVVAGTVLGILVATGVFVCV